MMLNQLSGMFAKNFFLQNLAGVIAGQIKRYSPQQIVQFAATDHPLWESVEKDLLEQHGQAGLQQLARQGKQMLGSQTLDFKDLVRRAAVELPGPLAAVVERNGEWVEGQFRRIWARFQHYSI